MSSEDEIVCEPSNRNRDAAVSLMINPVPADSGGGGSSIHREGHPNRPNEGNCAYITSLYDWWICTNMITKVKLLGFVLLPCLAIGLYIFHYTQHPGALHNPIAVLHPLSVVHPLIPTPFHSTVKFIEETAKDLLKKSLDVPVSTKKGPIVGRRYDPNPATGASYDAFLGIPYGHIPARFQLAEAPASWTTPRPARSDGPACPQPGVDFSEEDCLFVNVFTPKGASDSSASYPVIVFIHGSDFTSGSSSSGHYGPDFLVPKGVVLVTFNYRLGALGFLTLGSSEAPGNMGLFDTRLALRWVQDEIGSFGGDPRQVTLMGYGAGAVMAMYHYLSPASDGLLRYAVAQSGSVLSDWGRYTPEEGATRARSLAVALGCDTTTADDKQLVACLRTVNVTTLVDNQALELEPRFAVTGQTAVYLPVEDLYFADRPFFTDSLDLWLDTAVARGRPLLLGFTADEGIVKFAEDDWKNVETNLEYFIPPRLAASSSRRRKAAMVKAIRGRYFRNSASDSKVLDIVRILQDRMMIVPTLQVARRLANCSYGYQFDFSGPWTPDPSYISKLHVSGVNHGFDLRYLFYNADDAQDLGNCSTLRDSLRVRDMMVDWWTNFAKTGSPGSDWPKIAAGGYLNIKTNVSLMPAAAVEKEHNLDFWTSLDAVVDDSSANFATLNTFTLVFIVLWNVLVTMNL